LTIGLSVPGFDFSGRPPLLAGRRVLPHCADLDQVTDALIGAGYGAAGERCMAISVAVAVGDVGDRLLAKLTPRVQALKVGPGLDPQSEMGPLVTRQHRDKVMGYVDLGVKEGARLVVDGLGSSCRATRTATSWAAACSTTSPRT